MGQHDQFVSSMQTRLAKLQMIRRCWDRNDIKGAINALSRMSDHAVSILFLFHSVTADIVSLLTEKIDTITLDVCSSLLPLLNSLLDSDMDRYHGFSCYIDNIIICIFLLKRR
ncbi:putative katanin p80 subunit [Helianthus annuus]|nr:putative katanin p80 subunit [Helianthus annuus]